MQIELDASFPAGDRAGLQAAASDVWTLAEELWPGEPSSEPSSVPVSFRVAGCRLDYGPKGEPRRLHLNVAGGAVAVAALPDGSLDP